MNILHIDFPNFTDPVWNDRKTPNIHCKKWLKYHFRESVQKWLLKNFQWKNGFLINKDFMFISSHGVLTFINALLSALKHYQLYIIWVLYLIPHNTLKAVEIIQHSSNVSWLKSSKLSVITQYFKKKIIQITPQSVDNMRESSCVTVS